MRRRLAALTAALLTAGPALAGCAGDDAESQTAPNSGDFPIEVIGDFGAEPEVEFETPLQIDSTASEVLVEGDGPALTPGSDLLVDLYLANGTSGEKIGSTWEQGVPAQSTLSEESIFPAAYDALTGQSVGARVAIVAVPADAYGEAGASQLGVGKDDDLVMIIDVVSTAPSDPLSVPDGEEQTPAPGLPRVETEGDTVTGLDFSAADAPPKTLKVITLVEGDGPEVRDPSLVTLNYLGQAYRGKQPFDQSFDGEPVTFPVGIGNLIQGWDEGLIGVPAGSRVLLLVPPDAGYGPDGQPEAGIKGSDTLAFVIDVLGVG